MKGIKQFINEKYLIDNNIKTGEFGEILYDKSNKPYAICVIPKGARLSTPYLNKYYNNDKPIYMALLDKYEKLKWSIIHEELFDKIKNTSGKKATDYIYKNCDLNNYPAFKFIYKLTLGNTKRGGWFMGNEEEMRYIAEHITNIDETLKNNNISCFEQIKKDNAWGCWMIDEDGCFKDNCYCIDFYNNKVEGAMKDSGLYVIPLLEI